MCIFYVWVSVHHTLIYIKKTNLMQSSSMFIGNCKIALHVSAAFCEYAVANKHTARLYQVGFLYIYDVYTSVIRFRYLSDDDPMKTKHVAE